VTPNRAAMSSSPLGASSAGNKIRWHKECPGGDEHGVHIPDDNLNLCANSQKQDLAIDVGLGLRTPRKMANIGKFENMPSVLFNRWRK
jgi:hypothetical protein